MEKQNNNLDFLNKLSNILSEEIYPINTIASLNKHFKENLQIEDAEFIIWDGNNMILKDFIRDYELINNESKTIEINNKFSLLSEKKGEIFYFNDTEFPCDFSFENDYFFEDIIEDENIITFPLVFNKDVFGLMRIRTALKKFTKEFFELLNISSKFISGAIINYNLNEQMEVSLNFYKAMKDIAKIIESQYELSYIIPLIGEMIDRFMHSHLIYIFIYEKDKYKLVWPNACNDKKIFNMLKKLNKKTEYLLSDNSRIGIFPLKNEEKVIGAIAAYSNIDKLSQQDLDYLIQLTKQSELTIERANVYAEVLKHATMDALTGLNNRRQMEIRLGQEVSNAKRNNKELCCMMLDVDYFKKVNDTYGHAAGDCVLKNVSEIIKHEIREYDIACRYGGEEFFIILPQTSSKEAFFVAQRLRKVIENSQIDIKNVASKKSNYLNITVSIGVCAFDKAMSSEIFTQKADKALYKAKTTGRNRVILT